MHSGGDMGKTLFKAAAGAAVIALILMIAVISGTRYEEYRPADYKGEGR